MVDVSSPLEGDSIQHKVLVVDDSAVERNMFTYMLQRWGYTVTAVDSGEEAIKRIQAEKFQLILGDWHMAGMDGMEMVRQIRHLDLGFYVYIIMVSAQRAEDFLISALAVGADDMLTKPVDSNELEARLQSATRRIALQESLIEQNRRLADAHDLIAQDLSAVSRVQRSYLPEPTSRFSGLHYEWLSQPSQYVSGDHLQVFRLTDTICGFYLLDVSGHGIPAAVKSMQLTQMFTDMSATSVLFDGIDANGNKRLSTPSAVVGKLNELFQQTDSDLSYFTLLFGHFHLNDGRLVMCQAGHPSPLLIKGQGGIEAIGGGGYPVGLFDFNEFEDTELHLDVGDGLLIYSDGVTEVIDDKGEQFGQDRLMSTLANDWRATEDAALGATVLKAVRAWGGKLVQLEGFEDDISILLIQRSDPAQAVAPAQPLDLASQAKEFSQAQVFRSHDLLPVEADEKEEGSKRSVLIVDDSRSFLRIFEAMLNSWGYDVRAAQSGEAALQVIQSFKPDFVLTDWDMPGMSGIELCEQVRKNDVQSRTYLIMITGYASREQLLYSLTVGADDFLTKPVSPNELKVRLNAAERIFHLHNRLQLQNDQLSSLYEGLQRDMREVSRIQRALLPKNISEPWPVAIQTLYQPTGYVCGKQIGTLQTNANEIGFFMLSLPGRDTSSALQAMSLARWFSISRAIQTLFPMESASEKGLRYLADPQMVWRQIRQLTHSVTSISAKFELVYGLLNLKQGRLLVAGVGGWHLMMLGPDGSSEHISVAGADAMLAEDGLPMRVLYEGVIEPGTRFFLTDDSSAKALSFDNLTAWLNGARESKNSLKNDFYHLSSKMTDAGGDVETGNKQADLALTGFQWREFCPFINRDITSSELSDLTARLEQLETSDMGVVKRLPGLLNFGAVKASSVIEAVADTTNIRSACIALDEFNEASQYRDKLKSYSTLALSEALTNVMNHGFGLKKPEPLTLYMLAFEGGLALVIKDTGQPIPEKVLGNLRLSMDYTDDLDVYELPEDGMGLTFMSMVSHIFAVVHHEGVNQTWMVIPDLPDDDE